jgi:hypothetical protein
MKNGNIGKNSWLKMFGNNFIGFQMNSEEGEHTEKN